MAFSKAIRWVICAFFILFIVFMAVNSFLFTCRINPRETTDYLTDTPWAHLLLFAALGALGVWVNARGRRLTQRGWTRLTVITAALMLVGLVGCVLLSRSIPIFDQAACAGAAWSTAVGAYLPYTEGQYLSYFSFQIPFVLFCVPLSLLSGADNILILQLMNVVAIMVMIWALANSAALLTGDKRMEPLCWIGCLFFLPILFYSTFVYGTIVGGAFMLLGARQLILYLDDHRKLRMLWLGLCMTLACLMKMNYLIAMIAAGILLLLDSLETKRVFSVAAALCVALACTQASPLIIKAMEARTGCDLSQGFTLSSWVLPGLEEGDRSPGWYNEGAYELLDQAGGDWAETERLCDEALLKRVQVLTRDPAYALDFFYRKTVSQWNEPSYQSLWINEMMRNPERSPAVLSLYERGKLGKAALWWMNEYHWLMYAGVCLWLFFRVKKASLAELFFPLFFVGGFLFQLVWEAKSQYILMYALCMIPYAVAGYVALARALVFRRRGKKGIKG